MAAIKSCGWSAWSFRVQELAPNWSHGLSGRESSEREVVYLAMSILVQVEQGFLTNLEPSGR